MPKKQTKAIKKLALGTLFLITATAIGIHFSDELAPNIKDRLLVLFKYRQYQVSSLPTQANGQTVVDKRLGYKLPGKSAILPGAPWIPQTFNNCGPATTSMVLQYFGHNVSQVTTKEALRTNPTDSNVFTIEMSEYLKTFDVESKLFYNGDIKIIKTLIANGFYIVLENWLHPNEDIGHVTIIRGFDDDQGVLIADDSYIGTNITYKYEEFDQTQWKPFNREYLPVYKKEMEGVLKAIVGENWDQKKMYQNSVVSNNSAVSKNQKDMYSWFNLGTSYYALEQYDQAKIAFEKSRALGWPRRMLWYQYQPVSNYNKLGQYDKALELAQIGLAGNDSFAELHLESAIAHKGLGDLNKAKEEVDKALTYSPKLKSALDFKQTL